MSNPIQTPNKPAPVDYGMNPWMWVSCILFALAVFGCWGWFTWGQAKAEKGSWVGVFGDSFGVLNAAVSAIALLGVAYAIHQQHAALKMQSKELDATLREIKEGQEAQNASALLMQKQMQINGVRTEMELIGVLLGVETEKAHLLSTPLSGERTLDVRTSSTQDLRRQADALLDTSTTSMFATDRLALGECLNKIVGYRERREELYNELQAILASGR